MASNSNRHRRRKKYIKRLNKGVIRMLRKVQERHSCDLEPDAEKEPCISCNSRQKCLLFRRERSYIKKRMQ